MTTMKNKLIPTGMMTIPVVGDALTIDGLWADGWQENAEKAEAKDKDACACCGRAVKPGSGYQIWVVGGGDALAPINNWNKMNENYSAEWSAGNLGMLIVGPDCGKQIPTEYRTENLEA
jgi:hypothetical protein